MKKYAPDAPDDKAGYAVMPAEIPMKEWAAEQERKNRFRKKPTMEDVTESFADKEPQPKGKK